MYILLQASCPLNISEPNCLGFAIYPKSTCIIKGQLTSEEISQEKVKWKKYVQKSAFTPEVNIVTETSRNNLKNQLGLQLDENRVST